MNQELEIKVIERFFIREKKERYKSFVSNQKLRQKFINELAHSPDLDFSLFSEVIGSEKQIVKKSINTLRKADDCYVISENKDIDGHRINIDTALDETIGLGMGTLLVFGDADLVFYEGEEPNARWISKVQLK